MRKCERASSEMELNGGIGVRFSVIVGLCISNCAINIDMHLKQTGNGYVRLAVTCVWQSASRARDKEYLVGCVLRQLRNCVAL